MDSKVADGITNNLIMEMIMSNDRRPGKKPSDIKPEMLPKEKVMFLLKRVRPLLLNESTLLEIEPPVVICGDTHGQFGDLLDTMDIVGWPPKQRYLFMGDYVDRGDQSLELICLLYSLKVQYPKDFFVLRGNHETSEINSHYGFKEDCLLNYDLSVWDAFQDSFRCLPLVAKVGSKILCMHGGLSPAMQSLDDIRKIPRPVDIPDEGLACDLLWSDPTPRDEKDKNAPTCCGFSQNKNRLTSVWFDSDSVKEFLMKNDLELIVRGHELVDNGYEFTADKKVLTIFTAPFYCDHPNDAAVLQIDEQLRCQILAFIFKKTLRHNSPISSSSSLSSNELWAEVTLREIEDRK